MEKLSRRNFLGGSTLGMAAAGLSVPVLCAQDWARQTVDKSPRRRQWISVKQGNRTVESFVAYPEGAAKAPAMVVIHEIFGMSDWVEDVTDQFAAAGFVAIAPDLLSGMGPNGGRTKDIPSDGVGAAIRTLPPDQITADLNAVADYVKALSASNGQVCVVGFSWGGGQSFRFATNRRDLAAALVFYGNTPPADTMANIQGPVYGFYGGADARISGAVPQTEEQMKAAGKTYESVIYDGAAHGFMRSGEQPDATEPDKKARDAAWARIKEIRAKL